jgi:hypothetical protein
MKEIQKEMLQGGVMNAREVEQAEKDKNEKKGKGTTAEREIREEELGSRQVIPLYGDQRRIQQAQKRKRK